MTSSTLFGQVPTDTDAGNATALSVGLQFSLSQACQLSKFWWYSPSGADALPDAVAIYAISGSSQVSGTLISTPAWSGAAGSGWVSTAYGSPPSLAASTNYLAVVHGKGTSTGWYGRILSYWTSGAGSSGITSGPITAPSSAAAANGQMPTLNGASIAFPTSAGSGGNFLIDIEVTPTSVSGTAAVSAHKATLASAGKLVISGTGAVSARKASAAASGRTTVTGSAAVSAHKATLAGSGRLVIGGSAAVSAHKAAGAASGWATVTGTGAVRTRKARVSGSDGEPAFPAWPDAERAVTDLLAPLVAAGAIGDETPKGVQGLLPYIRVNRTGGSDDGVTDAATVSVDVFAAGTTAAKAVAEQARAILTLPVSRGGVAKQTDHGTIDRAVTVTGPVSLPPTDSGNLRLVVASYRVSMRRTPA